MTWVEKPEKIATQEYEKLRDENEALKAKIKALEPKAKDDVQSRAPRKELDTEIEFIADFDIVQAKGINISDSGICFELNQDLPFEMQFKSGEEVHRFRAHLIWVKRLPQGGYRLGLQFVPPVPFPQF